MTSARRLWRYRPGVFLALLTAAFTRPVDAAPNHAPPVAPAAAPFAAAGTDSIPALQERLEAALFTAINDAREATGLAPLLPDLDVAPLARERAAAQLSGPKLTHVGNTGRYALQALLAATGVPYALAGENLARFVAGPDTVAARTRETAAQVHAALLQSPLHRVNVLEPRFTHLAVGAAIGLVDGDHQYPGQREQHGHQPYVSHHRSGLRIVFAQVFRTTPATPHTSREATTASP
ncbi:MAG: CAP domain-containing protein [Chloroflexi bacterium]|nr:CAP domain-containing protein [Chloroflexota bacterium]